MRNVANFSAKNLVASILSNDILVLSPIFLTFELPCSFAIATSFSCFIASIPFRDATVHTSAKYGGHIFIQSKDDLHERISWYQWILSLISWYHPVSGWRFLWLHFGRLFAFFLINVYTASKWFLRFCVYSTRSHYWRNSFVICNLLLTSAAFNSQP